MIWARTKAFGGFWYDFVIGDDWRVALGVVAALTTTYLVTHSTVLTAWWILPLAVLILLPWSIHRVVRTRC